LEVVDPANAIPIVPIFVNAIHEPAPSPARCYRLGQIIRSAIESFDGVDTVGIYASGGLSHFTGGYPWRHYKGAHTHGFIDEAFDHHLIEEMTRGHGSALAQLSGSDLLDHGEIEFRSWLVALGAIGDVMPDFIEYQPFYRAIMGMGVGAWTLAPATSK